MDNMGICVCTNKTKRYKSDSDCFDVDIPYYYKTIIVQAARRGEVIERKKVKVYTDIEMGNPVEFSTSQFNEFFDFNLFKGEIMYTTNYQNIVTRMVFGKETRFSELDCKDRAKVNTYIQHRGHYSIYAHPELIRDSWEAVLQSAKILTEKQNI